jgi:hypothetical protein
MRSAAMISFSRGTTSVRMNRRTWAWISEKSSSLTLSLITAILGLFLIHVQYQ